tara:strand:+ start:2184 stop:3026 length:843 start_codon:yes stop_codon:yes gene_type:complete
MIKKKILVTGGAGFVGSNLCNKCAKDGHLVYSLDNYSTGTKSNHFAGVKYIFGDIRDFEAMPEVDIVFHLAGMARIQPSFEDVENYITTNTNGTLKMVQHCINKNIPIVYAGSSSKHSGKFKNPYTFSKDLGEDILALYKKHFSLKCSIARFYNVYGPNQITDGKYSNLIGRWTNNIKKNIPCEIYGNGEKKRDFTHVDDIVDALILIMEREAFGYEFELGRGKSYSINEVAKMCKIKPTYKKEKPGEAKETICDSKLAKKILNWTPKINLKEWIKNELV